MRTKRYKIGRAARLRAALCVALAAGFPPALPAGDGKWDGDNVDLHLYLENRAEVEFTRVLRPAGSEKPRSICATDRGYSRPVGGAADVQNCKQI